MKRMSGYLLAPLLVILSLIGCSAETPPPLKIITNAWIGYSPLFYAKEAGWLDPLNIKLSTVVSLGESMHIYQSAQIDAITGTQYEFNQLHAEDHSLMPIIMFDRSNGGDMVMSNHSIESLQKTKQPIDVYLEINSINHLIFKDFIKYNALSDHQFNFINKDQVKIVDALTHHSTSKPIIVVTYSPYNSTLQKQGFNIVASTQNGLELLVLDALYTTKEGFVTHHTQYIELKKIIDQAILKLKEDPQAFYEKVKPYLENSSYPDFQAALKGIEWLNQPLDPVLIQRLNASEFPVRDLL